MYQACCMTHFYSMNVIVYKPKLKVSNSKVNKTSVQLSKACFKSCNNQRGKHVCILKGTVWTPAQNIILLLCGMITLNGHKHFRHNKSFPTDNVFISNSRCRAHLTFP